MCFVYSFTVTRYCILHSENKENTVDSLRFVLITCVHFFMEKAKLTKLITFMEAAPIVALVEGR